MIGLIHMRAINLQAMLIGRITVKDMNGGGHKTINTQTNKEREMKEGYQDDVDSRIWGNREDFNEFRIV